MKRIVSIAIALMMAVAMSAQVEGKWIKQQSEADELKGSSGGTYYSYTVSGLGSFTIYGFDKFQYFLISEKEQFNIETGYSRYSGSYAGISVLVGIYDENDKLTEKFKMWLDRVDNKGNRIVRTRDAGGMSNPVGQKGKVKKIFKALQSDGGYVRIVAERFQSTDFDIKISPFKE